MKILRLDLIAFGPFTNSVLDLGGGEQGLHIIYGPNEAGKSSTLRAIHYLLYGFPRTCPDAFVHPYSKLRIGGMISRSDGTVLEFVRRKQGLSLWTADESRSVEESSLMKFLNNVDARQFETRFGINHERMVAGGKELVQGGGSSGQVLFAAGAGISDLHNVQAALRAEADALFKPRASNPEINAALSEFRTVQQDMRAAWLSGQTWEQHDQSLRTARHERKDAETALANLSRRKNRLERVAEALPRIVSRRELLDEYRNYENAVLVPDDFPERRRQAFEDLRVAEARKTQSAAHLAEIRDALDRLEVPDPVIAYSERIRDLFQESGSIRKASGDRLRLEADYGSLRADMREIFRGLGRTGSENDPLEQAENLRPKTQEVVRIQELGREYESLGVRYNTARESVEKLRFRVSRLQAGLEKTAAPPDAAFLRQAIENARRHGDLENRYQRQSEELYKAEKNLEQALKNFPYWSGPPEKLAMLRVPPEEQVNSFELRFKKMEDALDRVRADTENREQVRLDVESRIQEIRLSGEVPTERDLQNARNWRDTGWQIIREAWETGRADRAADFVAAFPSSRTLAEAYESSVRMVDDTGDRLRREADQVARKAGLLAEQEKIARQMDYLESEHEKIATVHVQLAAEWASLWKSAGLAPAASSFAAREMQVWLRKHAALTAQMSGIGDMRRDVEAMWANISACRNELSRCLEGLEYPPADNRETLVRLLEQSVQIADVCDKARIQRERDVADMEARRAELREAELCFGALEQDLAKWRNHWGPAVACIGLEPDATPAQAATVLEDLKDLFAKLREADTLDKRIQGIDRDAGIFAEAVAGLLNAAAPELSHLPPEQAAKELNTRLDMALNLKTRREGFEKQEAKETAILREAAGRIAEIRARLETMCQEAGCLSSGDLPEAEKRSAQRKYLEAELKRIEEELRRLSGGAALEDFIREAEGMDPDGIGPEIRQIEDEMERLRTRCSELDRTIGMEENELGRMDGNDTAAGLAEKSQCILARMDQDVRRYARLQLAAAVLGQAVEQYRQKNRNPVLARAGELFARMTLGAFEGIREDMDEKNGPILVGVRLGPGGRESVRVEQMSDGTADQLYLAVRLASLETGLDPENPMPFIVDDILVQFDDRRAGATLEVLAELSRRTQVIFFTHHQHLLDVARKSVPDGVLFTQQLDG